MLFRQQLQLEKPTAKAVLLRQALSEASSIAPANTALLLSGRIDSSALAAFNPALPTYTAGLEGSPDLKYARKVAEVHRIRRSYAIEWTQDKAIEALRETVVLMQSYDLATLSDMIVHACAKKAKEDGIRIIRTGDPADEIFESDGSEVDGILKRYRPQSERIALRLGLGVDYPYMNEKVRAVARILRLEDNVKEIDGSAPSDFYEYYKRKHEDRKATSYTWTKVALRSAMHGVLSNDVVYRMKAPLQYGAWTYKLTETLAYSVTEAEIARFENKGIRFWQDYRAAHAGLRRIFDLEGLEPLPITNPAVEYPCIWCSGAVEREINICYTCGGSPPFAKL